MATVGNQIQNASEAICHNIATLSGQRTLLSQNILSQVRNLVEGIAVLLHTDSPTADFTYPSIAPALRFVASRAQLRFITKFHNLIEKVASHYTFDGDTSERLMLKYYEYLYRLRVLVKDKYDITLLANLEDFPVDLDRSLQEYHEKIAARIEAVRSAQPSSSLPERYYIHKTRPFFVRGRVYYEVTFCRAINKVSKFDRIIAFTDIDMTDKYAAYLTLQRDSIAVLGQTMPITIIRKWGVSIRPCEFDNFARLVGINIKTQTDWMEYRYLMHWLTATSGSILDIIDMSDDQYATFINAGTFDTSTLHLFPILEIVRSIVRTTAPGHNLLRYLMLRMHNQILKPQYNPNSCSHLSGLKCQYGCIPFDTMPFCTSLPGHNPRYWDIVESLDATERIHELLARRVNNNVESRGMLYTPVGDLEVFGDINSRILAHNNNLYYKHTERRLMLDKEHVFTSGYEDDTVLIVNELQTYALSGIAGYTQAVDRWLNETRRAIDDPVKVSALRELFSHSCIALIYGAAGTGKSTMIDHIAQYFNERKKLFLAHTNPAIDNLKRKVNAQNSDFRTISSHINRKHFADEEFDLLVVDECSTVSNSDFIQVLNRTNCKLLVLVGDVYQIESIQFGNWFRLIRSFMPEQSVFELTKPYRTKSDSLLRFWDKMRNIGDDITEVIAQNGYSHVLDNTLFEPQASDEIILCLNYDGLYGINNINRFLQSSNPGAATAWRESIYKVGDPVLFHETERFRPVIYNNLKGWIKAIVPDRNRIQFDVELERPVSAFDVYGSDLEWVDGSIVRFSVYDHSTSDQDDDSLVTTVPFQVAYAVSIHKAQGLEYDSVKIVITDANEEHITHNILYTAITRTRDRLRIFWTPETQETVLSSLSRSNSSKDAALLKARRGVVPVGG